MRTKIRIVKISDKKDGYIIQSKSLFGKWKNWGDNTAIGWLSTPQTLKKCEEDIKDSLRDEHLLLICREFETIKK